MVCLHLQSEIKWSHTRITFSRSHAHDNYFLYMGAYIARPRYRSETRFARILARIFVVAPWWSAYTCSLKSNDPTQESSLVEDTHVPTFLFMGAYIARPRCRLETRFARIFARMCFVAPWWSAYTCSLRSNDPTLKSNLVKDMHVQTILCVFCSVVVCLY